MTDTPFQAVVAAPGFCLGIHCNEDEISGISFIEPQAELAPRTPLAKETVRQLRAWIDDADHRFSLPLQSAGTAFQRRVWTGIATIPRGETRTYGALAAAVGSGPRAVGNACGANPYPVVVPCHRVLAAGGGLGGFARTRGGFLLGVKAWLLDHERR